MEDPMPVPKKSTSVTKVKTSEEILGRFRRSKTEVDPDAVLQEAEKEMGRIKPNKFAVQPTGNIFKAMTLLEFENGILMTTAVPDQYRAFGVQMLRQLQIEYLCETTSEKATAELATVNYIRTLEIQSRINRYLALTSISELGLKFLAIMSKELDRANRHYLTSVQNLKMMKQTPMQLNIKTETAIIGQNQLVQANKND